jgi:trimethylamine corrinoid protein
MIETQIINEAKQAIIDQDKEKAIKLAERVISEGGNPLELMNEAFIPGISEVGDLFGRGQLFLPELIQAADAMKAVTDILDDAIPEAEEKQKKGVILIATVKGDVHDIGKCIVVSLLSANGFTVHDIGRDIDTNVIIVEAVKVNADIIGTSALLTTTMPRQKELEVELKKAGVRERFKTIVGGAPVTKRWAEKIGADAYAEDAQDAVLKVKELLLQ